MKFGKFLQAREEACGTDRVPANLPYKQLKKILKHTESPARFLELLDTTVDALERDWRVKAFQVLRSETHHFGPPGHAWAWRFKKNSHHASSSSETTEDAAAALGEWAALNSLALRKIVKKFEKAAKTRCDEWSGAVAQQPVESSAEWAQRALNRLSFARSVLRVEILALGALGAERRSCAIPKRPRTASCGSDDDTGVDYDSIFGRFDAELALVGSNVADETSCNLCFEVMVAPVSFVACGHPVCRPCFDRMVAVDANARCPICRSNSLFSVEMVHLKRLARAKHAVDYVARRNEMRALAHNRTTWLAAARALFPTHATTGRIILRPPLSQALAQKRVPEPHHHIARLFPVF